MRALLWLRRLVLAAGWLLLVLVSLAAGAIWWLTGTPQGVQWSLAQAETYLPAFQVEEVEGTPWSGLSLKGVAWQPEQGASLDLAEVQLQIDPVALWRGHLRVGELSLRDGQLDLPETQGAPAATGAEPTEQMLPAWTQGMALEIESLHVDSMVVTQGDQRYQLGTVRLAALLDARVEQPRLEVNVAALQLGLPNDIHLDASGEAAIGLTEDLPVVAGLDVFLDLPQGWLSGELAVDGLSRAGLTIRPRLSWVGANGVMAATCGQMTWDGRDGRDGQNLAVPNLVVDALGGRLLLDGRVGFANGWWVNLQGRGESIDPARAGIDLPGTLAFDWQADLKSSAGWWPLEGRLAVEGLNGRLVGEPIEDLDVAVVIDDQAVALDIDGQAGGGEMWLEGRLDAQRLVEAAWRIEALPVAALPAGEDEASPLFLNSEGRLSGQLPDWQQPLTMADWLAQTRLVLEPTQLGLSEQRGEQSRRVQLDLQGRLAEGALSISRTALDMPGASAHAEGVLQLAPQPADWRLSSGQGRVSIPDLAALPWDMLERLPGLDLAALRTHDARGSINIELNAAGPVLDPHGQLDLRVDGLRLAGYDLDRLRARASAESASRDAAPAERRIQLSVEAGSLTPIEGTVLFDRLAIAADGRLSEHRWTLELDGPLEARLAAQGGWQEDAWQGRLTRLDIGVPEGHPWRLDAPAALSASVDAQRIEGLCLQPAIPDMSADRAGSLCLTGERGGQALTARLQGDLALEALWQQSSMLDVGSVRWPGRLSLDAEARIDANARAASLDLRLPASEIRLTPRDEEVEDEPGTGTISYPDTRLTARLADERVEASLRGGLEDWLAFEGQGEAALDNGSLDGALLLEEADLARLFGLLDRLFGPLGVPVSDLAGSLSGRLAVTGRLDDPRLSGRLVGEQLAFASLPTGTDYRDGRVELAVNADGDIRLTGELLGEADTPPRPVFSEQRVTETEPSRHRGRLSLEGRGRFGSFADWNLDLMLGGEAIPLLRLPTLAVDARPDLEIVLTPSGGRIDGEIHVPLVIAQLAELPETARENSPDLVIVGEEEKTAGGAYPIEGEVDVILGEHVSLQGQGFATRLVGQLELRLRGEQPPGVFGEIRLEDGRYTAYGQNLRVERGRLIFTGPMMSPGLDVVASRKIGDAQGTVVGLSIAGELESPQTELFSRPPTSESDALSLLLTGRRLSEGGDADASLLLGAIAGLGIKQGDSLAQQINSVVGFDEIGLESADGVAGTRLSVGKRIGEDLLVRYVVGVFDGVGEVITRYRINNFLHLELTSSAQSQSGDLIYQIDRGHPED
ncbi:translocation/assembly module TamB domain-containing protein [Guyparkeria sp. 1SP6A2]|nr:translocation/assembly module TamB domain-containing protein [Guyparkeria sp. 1SP6A2]